MLVNITVIFFTIFLVVYCKQEYTLQQVLILSRHNVRTPLSKNLGDYTPKQWPKWKEKSGYLTAKGVLLEGFMGEYFSSWLLKEGLLNDVCPSEQSFYVYANTAQRTMASAKAFVEKAFPMCNITIHHSDETKDPIFNPVIHNTSAAFKWDAIEEMRTLLKSLHLNNSYEDLENILDYSQSEYCLKERNCDLVSDLNKIYANVGSKPNVEGPLKISKSVIDSFVMENYEGFPNNKVAWGLLNKPEQWDEVLDLSRGYHNVIFNTTLIAKDVAQPLLEYMKKVIENDHKVILFMGHDANIYTLLKSLGFKPYNLKNQYEKVPAGGKMVFQKWRNEKTGELFARVEYVYQCTDQMRTGKSLSLENPPEFTLLEMENCKIDENGFCPWQDFLKLLDGVTH